MSMRTLNDLRIAFVHDWLVVAGGAEKVTREVLRTFPADVFALVDHLPDREREDILGGRRARTSFIQHLPFSRRAFRYYLPLFPRAMERLDLSGYDMVLSASYAVAKGVRTLPGQVHVCYIHTPMRYAWIQEDGYLRDHGMGWGPRRAVVRRTLRRLRSWDLSHNARIHRFIANSHNVAERVERCYGRHADVLLPPVDTDLFTLRALPRTHFLAAARMVPYKRLDAIIGAFRLLPAQHLVVCGDGPERRRLEREAPPNVRFAGHVPDTELAHLMQQARALLVAADEDLGLAPLEAQACGTPVIALGRGGHLETVVEGRSGTFFQEATPAAIAEAVERFLDAGVERDAVALRDGVLSCSAVRFRERYRALVEQTWREHGH